MAIPATILHHQPPPSIPLSSSPQQIHHSNHHATFFQSPPPLWRAVGGGSATTAGEILLRTSKKTFDFLPSFHAWGCPPPKPTSCAGRTNGTATQPHHVVSGCGSVTPRGICLLAWIGWNADIEGRGLVRSGTLAKAGEKRKERDEASKSESVKKDKKKAKGRRRFVATVPPRRENGNFPKCTRCKGFHAEKGPCIDPNVVTGTYSLKNLYATVLFDFGANFSFVSTKFAPLLNKKPIIANPGYMIEVANGKKEEVDRIFHGCRLELGDSIFFIDLIPLGQGSFDVIVGMDWL
ncbi:reverse transcriptase domain-containing protein [Tanacetum coccineum]